MSEPIIEQIGQWIESAVDGAQDPEQTMTLRAVRPGVLDWNVTDYRHGDVIIEAQSLETQSKTNQSRLELGVWKLYGIIRELPAASAADAVIARMIETIRRTLMAGNSQAVACGGLAAWIDCAQAAFGIFEGGLIAEVTASVMYGTKILDGYAAPSAT